MACASRLTVNLLLNRDALAIVLLLLFGIVLRNRHAVPMYGSTDLSDGLRHLIRIILTSRS
jgi:hypothetical protein